MLLINKLIHFKWFLKIKLITDNPNIFYCLYTVFSKKNTFLSEATSYVLQLLLLLLQFNALLLLV